jgi:DNA-binding transcriptional ArsR family regulator
MQIRLFQHLQKLAPGALVDRHCQKLSVTAEQVGARNPINVEFLLAAPLTIGNHLVTVIGNRMVTQRRRQHDAVFRAISDPTRRKILGILRGGRHTVGEIAGNFRMSRPAISKHLRLLHAAGLVVTRKQGTASLCSLDARPLRAIDDWLQDYQTFWSESIRSLKKYMEENS